MKKLLCILLAMCLLLLVSCKNKPSATESSEPEKTAEVPQIILTDPKENTESEEVLPDSGNYLSPDETKADAVQKKSAAKTEKKTESKAEPSKTSAAVTVKDDGTMTFGKKAPDSPWAKYVADADPKTGISWDGKSKIVYTYEDGTTGTKPVVGATYEVAPGMVTVLSDVEMPGWQPEPFDPNCNHCGKKMGDGKNGTCIRWLSGDMTCPNCGEFVPGNTCHTCQ